MIKWKGIFEQGFKVQTRDSGDFFHRDPFEFGHFLRHEGHKTGIVGLAPVRRGRQVGTVGFDEHALQGHLLGDFFDLKRILEGDDAGKRDVKPQLQGRLGDLPVFGKTVKHTAHRACSRVLALFFQDPQGVF